KKQGAAVFEFDFIPRSWNYLGTLLPRDPGAASESPETRMAFTDILAFPGFSPPALAKAGFSTRDAEKTGRLRFCGVEPYEVLEIDKARQKAGFRLGAAEAPVSALGSIEINKVCCLKRDGLSVQYRLVNQGARKTEFDFAPRLDLVFPGEGEKYLRVYKAGPGGRDALGGGQGELSGTQAVELDDLENELIITLSCNRTFDAHFVPVYADCPVYGRERRLYQSTCVLPVTRLSLESGDAWSAEYTLRLAH
ncbi:MAG: hypothetical protein LBH15_06930, partial [Treponema sp.]|nr:hypothetical protein [Treponema sp.]